MLTERQLGAGSGLSSGAAEMEGQEALQSWERPQLPGFLATWEEGPSRKEGLWLSRAGLGEDSLARMEMGIRGSAAHCASHFPPSRVRVPRPGPPPSASQVARFPAVFPGFGNEALKLEGSVWLTLGPEQNKCRCRNRAPPHSQDWRKKPEDDEMEFEEQSGARGGGRLDTREIRRVSERRRPLRVVMPVEHGAGKPPGKGLPRQSPWS